MQRKKQQYHRGLKSSARGSGGVVSIDKTQLLAICALVCLLGIAVVLGVGLARQNVVQTVVLSLKQTPLPTSAPTATPYVPVQVAIGPAAVPAQTDTVEQVFSPTILIYHTHATEAYTQNQTDPYKESGEWRTKDQSKSVVAVGALLAELLTEKYGFQVVHDTTNHEPPKLSTAYSRSEVTMEAYLERYPSLQLFIDLHRDAYGSSGDGEEDFVILDGLERARLMFVVGNGQGATGTGFDEMPDYEANFALAERVTNALAAIDPKLVRQVRVKTGRYNQHVGPMHLLTEVGHNRNTLSQALNSVPLLAGAIAACLLPGGGQSAHEGTIAVWAPAG